MKKFNLKVKITKVYINTSGLLSNIFETFENILEFSILFCAFLPLLPSEIKSKCMKRHKVDFKRIGNSENEVKIAEIYIKKIQEEYIAREAKIESKIKSFTNIISLAFTFIFGTLVYIFKDLKLVPHNFFYISVVLMFIALYCILIFYKVSNFNKVQFTEDDYQCSICDYLTDVLYCIGSNHQRLNYSVTIYKAALRYFIASLAFLLFAMIKQFLFVSSMVCVNLI